MSPPSSMRNLGAVVCDIKINNASHESALSTFPEKPVEFEGSLREWSARSLVGEVSTESSSDTTTRDEKEDFHSIGASLESDLSNFIPSTNGEDLHVCDKKRKYKSLYKAMRVAYDNLFEELLATKGELAGTKEVLSTAQRKIEQMRQESSIVDLADRERTELRQMRVAQAELVHDYGVVLEDRDKLFDECIELKRLLAIKDNQIGSLAGQVKLLVQMGTLAESSRKPTNVIVDTDA